MKQMIFSNWTFYRILRLGIGIAIIVQAVMAKDTLFGIAGLLFTGMAIFNVGCCGASACNTAQIKSTKPIKDISYEEVV
jgi:hypothetical protein